MIRPAALLGVALALGCNKEREPSPAPAPEPPSETTAEPAEPPAAPAADDKKKGWSGADPFEPPAIAIAGDRVTISLTRRDGVILPAGRVPYTAEPYNVMGEPGPDDTVSEADILGTGLALDLDGDGDMDDAIPVACDDGVIEAAGSRWPPLGGATDQVRTYTPDRIARLGDAGAWAVSYTPCEAGPATLGLSPADQPIEILRTDGPALQVLVFTEATAPVLPEPVELRISADGVVIATRTYTGLAYEPVFADQPSWSSMAWTMIPVRDADQQSFSFTLPAAEGRRKVVAAINLSSELDKRSRMNPAAAGVP